jgi:hypothetical protein
MNKIHILQHKVGHTKLNVLTYQILYLLWYVEDVTEILVPELTLGFNYNK